MPVKTPVKKTKKAAHKQTRGLKPVKKDLLDKYFPDTEEET